MLHKLISISREIFQKAIELGLSMDMDLAVAIKSCWCCYVKKKKLEATNLPMKLKN
jgi:hypothetical protein